MLTWMCLGIAAGWVAVAISLIRSPWRGLSRWCLAAALFAALPAIAARGTGYDLDGDPQRPALRFQTVVYNTVTLFLVVVLGSFDMRLRRFEKRSVETRTVLSSPKDMHRVHQIDHMTLVVRDLAAAEKFYRDRLGMEVVTRPAFDFEGRWFRAGQTLVHLIAEHERSGPAGINEDGRPKSTRGPHLAFAVSDAGRFAEELDRQGVQRLGPTKRRPDGAAQAFFLDPDGHIIELTSAQ